MTEKIKKLIEELARECAKEDDAKILQIAAPGEPGEPSAEDLRRREALEKEYKTKSERFKKQLEEALKFRQNHFKYGLELAKVRYLLELERAEEWEGITNAFNYGYMVGYKAAQRNARKKTKAAADDQEGAKRA